MTGHRMPMELPDLGGIGPCRDVDPDLFFPGEALEETRAQELASLCGTCPVAEQCLEFALSRTEVGIWAGTTTAQRKKLRRRARVPNAQQQRLATSTKTVSRLADQGCTPRQIIAQTGLHPQSVWRILRRLDGADSGTRAA